MKKNETLLAAGLLLMMVFVLLNQFFLFSLCIMAGLVLLQFSFSKKPEQWMGFILPGVMFVFSLILTFAFKNTMMYTLLVLNIPTEILMLEYLLVR